MKIHIKFIFFTLISGLLLGLPLSAEDKNVSREITSQLENLFAASRKVNAVGEEKEKARLAIERSMDWDKIAKMCLGPKYVKKNAGKNLAEFTALLKEVVVKSAYTRLDKFWDSSTKYKFENIEINGGTAKIPTKFSVKGDAVLLEYYFSKKGNQWMIYDISYEDIRYSTNISEQIDAFLKDGNFATLLEKLRKRRDELIEETSKPKKS